MFQIEYQHIHGVNSHALKALQVSPAACWAQYLDPHRPQNQRAISSSVRLGLMVHCLSLTPELFDIEFAVIESRRTKEGKQKAESPENLGKTIVTIQEFETAHSIVESLTSRKGIAKLLSAPLREHLIIKDRGANLLPLKARLDAYSPDDRLVIELKTVRSLDFINEALTKYQYLLSAVFYMAIADARDFVFVFVETSPPYTAVTLELTPRQIKTGWLEYQEALRRFDECWESNTWPSEGLIDDDPLFMVPQARPAESTQGKWSTIDL